MNKKSRRPARKPPRLPRRPARHPHRARPRPAPAQGAAEAGLRRRDLASLGDLLLSRRGEASGVALAQTLLAAFAAASPTSGWISCGRSPTASAPTARAVEAAIEAPRREGAGIEAIEALHAAAEPRRQELVRRLNLAPGGTAALVRMREELLKHLRTASRSSGGSTPTSRISSRPGSTAASWCCATSTGRRRPTSWRRSSATRRCTRSGTGTTCATGSSRPTGAATASSTRSSSTSR